MRSFGRFFLGTLGPVSGITGLLSWFNIGPSVLVDFVESHVLVALALIFLANVLMLPLYRSSMGAAQISRFMTAPPAPTDVAPDHEPSVVALEQRGCLTLQANAGCVSAQVTLLSIVLIVFSIVAMRNFFSDSKPGGNQSALVTPQTVVATRTTAQNRPTADEIGEEWSSGGSGGMAAPQLTALTGKPAGASPVAVSPIASPAYLSTITALPTMKPDQSP